MHSLQFLLEESLPKPFRFSELHWGCPLAQSRFSWTNNQGLHPHKFKAVLKEKLKGAWCSEPVKSTVPSNLDFYETKLIFSQSPKSASEVSGATVYCWSTKLKLTLFLSWYNGLMYKTSDRYTHSHNLSSK